MTVAPCVAFPARQQVQRRGGSKLRLRAALHPGRSMRLHKAHRWTLTQRYEGAPHIKGREVGWLQRQGGVYINVREFMGRAGIVKAGS